MKIGEKIGPKLNDDFSKTERIFIKEKNEVFQNELVWTKSISDLKLPNLEIEKNELKIDLTYSKQINSCSKEDDSCFSPISPTKEDKTISLQSKAKNQLNLFNIFKRARNFANKIKNTIYFRNYNNLTKHQKKIIQDNSEFEEIKNSLMFKFVKCSWLYSICNFFNKYFLKYFAKFHFKPVNPDYKIKKLWDCFLLILTFINFFILSLELSLSIINFISEERKGNRYNADDFYYLKLLNFSSYLFDIILCFITGFHDIGKIVTDFKEIRKYYLKNLFLWDFLAFLPNLLLIFRSETENYFFLNILFVFIHKKYSTRLKDFQEFIIQEKEDWDDYFSIFILYMKTLFISHLLACMWYILGDYNPEKNNTWLYNFKYNEFSWSKKYLNSLYLSMVTMLTVGYGDVTPINEIEKLFCIITMLIGFTVFGFTLGSICDIIQKMNSKNQELKESFKIVTRLMKKSNVDFDFQFRVRKYIEYIFKEEKDRSKEINILNSLSKPIKEEFLNQIYGKKFKNIPFFFNNFSTDCVKAISSIVKKIDIAPAENIIKSNEIDNFVFYFLFKGEVEVSFQNNMNEKKIFQYNLKEDNYFNLIAFVSNMSEKQNIKTVKFCTFYTINRNDFISLLKANYPSDYEIFCKIYEQIKFDSNISNLFVPCLSCKKLNHSFINCPFVHYIPNCELSIKRFNFSIELNRIFRTRKLKKYDKTNTLFLKKQLTKWSNNEISLFRPNSYKSDEDEDLEDDEENETLSSRPIIKTASVEEINKILIEVPSPNLLDIDSEKFKRKKTEKNNSGKEKTALFHELNKFKINDDLPECINILTEKREQMGLNKLSNNDDLELYDYNFEKPNEYKNYKPFQNLKESIAKYVNLMRIKEKNRRRYRHLIRKSKYNG